MTPDPSSIAAKLRRRAEAAVASRATQDRESPSLAETQRLLHELQVHQVELEMQNDELRHSRDTFEAATARYTDLYDFAPVGYLTLDLSGAMVEVNLAAARLLGSERAELVGQRLAHFVTESDRRVFSDCIGGAFTADVQQICEVLLADNGMPGTPRALRVEASRSEDGATSRVVLHDVSARRRQEAEMRLLETCVAHLNDIVLVTDASAAPSGPRIVFANAACERITGYSQAELIGQTPRIWQGRDTDRTELARIGAALRRGEPVRAELLNYAKDGSAYWIELNITPVHAAGGELTHFVAIERDITERGAVQARMAGQEQALRRSEARSTKAEALASFGTWDSDLAGGNSTWSDSLFGIYGRRLADGVPAFDAWQETIHPDDRARLQDCIDQALAGAYQYAIDFRIHTKDTGALRHISSRGESMLDGQGRVARLWGVDQDVTERKLAEDLMR